jgi:hypothetical protein
LRKEFFCRSSSHAPVSVQTLLAVGIVDVPFLFIGEDIVCMADFLELVAGSSIAYILIWVVFQRELHSSR